MNFDLTSSHFISLGIIMLLGAMSPGPDFAVVVKNTLTHSRRAGIFTAFGITAAICVHMTYCVLGFAAIIRESVLLFQAIQYIGAAYLAYLGFMILKAKSVSFSPKELTEKNIKITSMSGFSAFKQGFICNLLNPKATLFFLTLFSVITSDELSLSLSLGYALEIILITIIWFSLLAFLLTHSAIQPFLDKARNGIEKTLGVCLVLMAVGIFVFS